jgi:hypothetical protein
MTERYSREDHEEYRRQQDAEAAREERERREGVEKGNAQAAWVRDGGRPADFEREWPKLRDELRRRRLVDADERARAAHQSLGVSEI